MRYIDLSHTLRNDMPVYPGDPPVELTRIAEVTTQGFTDHLLKTGLHVGTHIDGPLHVLATGKKLSDMPAEKFFGKGVVLDARGLPKIDIKVLQGKTIGAGDVVLILTGFSSEYGKSDYYEKYPEMTLELAQALIDARVSIVGIDTPSPDRPPFEVHKLLLKNEVLIIENLTNLESLLDTPNFEVMALPIKLAADSGLARVMAKIEI
jgi:kynurenine formamidase